MKVSLNWLTEFVEVPKDPRRLRADLTKVGLNTESFVPVGDDFVFEVEVTTNRPDCLSHYGIAREIATIYGKALRLPSPKVAESGLGVESQVSIEIADPTLCARYCGRVIQNVQVKDSPDWLKTRLAAVGLRPINNVADATNYVLMELGHPLHAFDLARLKQQKVIVRRAGRGEQLRTLDGTERALTPENLVIADAERPVALAGVMGGLDSEISLTTRSVLLESAWFDPVSVRRTAKAQGLHTEASHRFERGADVEMAPVALDRVAELILQIAGGQVLRGIADIYPAPEPRVEIHLPAKEVLRVLGFEVPGQEVTRILQSLGFVATPGNDGGWGVHPPSFRLDVKREVDLVEEVARHYGYDRLPARLRPAPPRVQQDTIPQKELTVSTTLTALGYREIIPSSMVDPGENARFTDLPPVVLANPLSQEASALRSSTVPCMLQAIRWNLDRDQMDLRFFDAGKIYWKRADGLPKERRVLTLGLSGYRRPEGIHGQKKELDFFDVKGDVETLFRAFDLPDRRFEPVACPYNEHGHGGRFIVGDKMLTICGLLSRSIGREYKLRQDVWLAEIDLEQLFSFPLRQRGFRPYSKFPAVERDFSLVVSDRISYQQLEEAIKKLRLEEVQSLQPLDLFRGGATAASHYSILLRVTFQSSERTLTREEIAELSQHLLDALKPLGISLRS